MLDGVNVVAVLTMTYKPALNTLSSVVLSFFIAILLTACGAGGSNSSNTGINMPTTMSVISGHVNKGPVANGTVTGYAVTRSGIKGLALNTAMTDANGSYSLAIKNYAGPMLLELTGGSYKDEVTGQPVNVPARAGSGLQAALANVTGGATIQAEITPLTSMAAALARAMVGGLTASNIAAANLQVASYFGGIDIVNVQPINPLVANSATGPVTQNSINYGLILAGLSQEALGLANPYDLVTALVQDFSDGAFNGESYSTPIHLNGMAMHPSTGTSELATAIGTFSNSVLNVSGGTASSTLLTSIRNSPTGHTVGGTVSGLVGTVVLRNSNGDILSLSSDRAFVFSTPVAAGASYLAVVSTQPSGQICNVAHGSGTVGLANVTDIAVNCSTAYTIGITVSGLNGSGLVLQNNGGDDLAISANGSATATFGIALAAGSAYEVTVLSDPTGQTCFITNGGGSIVNSNVVNVGVKCSAIQHNTWVWMSGGSTVNSTGIYGTQGTAAVANAPGARDFAVSWTGKDGNLWLFGGFGVDSTGNIGVLSDLWRYDGTNWTWHSGSNIGNVTVGVYGTKGVAAPTNAPPALQKSTSWTDTNGNLWLFGGFNSSYFNTLWKFDGTNWTWISGSNLANTSGVYGTKGATKTGNYPGARYGAASWTDAQGIFWLFGGYGFDKSSTTGALNDLWKFDGTNWTWVSGSNIENASGVYGTKGTADITNVPGARYEAVSSIDTNGNLWLFGGYAYDSAGNLGLANDLWKFDGAKWTWVSGSNLAGSIGVYGTKGVAASKNYPGARENAISWTDANGHFWLFGGTGLDSSGNSGLLSDLWKFDGANWIWMSGDNGYGTGGVYGTKGVADPSDVPGARQGAVSWIDANGKLWLFGGTGVDGAGSSGELSDLWQYEP